MFILPNDKKLDEEAICLALENSDLNNHFFLDAETGEIEQISEIFDDYASKKLYAYEKEPSRYFAVPHVPTREQYRWMEEFINDMVYIEESELALKLTRAIKGKGAFRKFKDILINAGDAWIDAWHQWKNDYLYREMMEWLASLTLNIREDIELDDDCALCQTLKHGDSEFKLLQKKFREARKNIN